MRGGLKIKSFRYAFRYTFHYAFHYAFSRLSFHRFWHWGQK